MSAQFMYLVYFVQKAQVTSQMDGRSVFFFVVVYSVMNSILFQKKIVTVNFFFSQFNHVVFTNTCLAKQSVDYLGCTDSLYQ